MSNFKIVFEINNETNIIYANWPFLNNYFDFAIVNRNNYILLDEKWNHPGIYILLDNASESIYIGRSNTFKKRLYNHFKDNKKDWATKALLLTNKEFNSAHSSYLESKLINIFKDNKSINCRNKAKSEDNVLNKHEKEVLDNNVIDNLIEILKIFNISLGANLDVDNKITTNEVKTNKLAKSEIDFNNSGKIINKEILLNEPIRSNNILLDLVNKGIISSEIVPYSNKYTEKALILSNAKILLNDIEYSSLSSAASYFYNKTNNKGEVSGWNFWSIVKNDKKIKLNIIKNDYLNSLNNISKEANKTKNVLPKQEKNNSYNNSSDERSNKIAEEIYDKTKLNDSNQNHNLDKKENTSTIKSSHIKIKDLLDKDFIKAGTIIYPKLDKYKGYAIILENGRVLLDNIEYRTLSAAADNYFEKKNITNGWFFWNIKEDNKLIPLMTYKELYLKDFIAKGGEIIDNYKSKITVKDLLDNELLIANEILYLNSNKYKAQAQLLSDGKIRYDNKIYNSLSTSASEIRNGLKTNGWDWWAVKRNNELITLAELRKELE